MASLSAYLPDCGLATGSPPVETKSRGKPLVKRRHRSGSRKVEPAHGARDFFLCWRWLDAANECVARHNQIAEMKIVKSVPALGHCQGTAQHEKSAVGRRNWHVWDRARRQPVLYKTGGRCAFLCVPRQTADLEHRSGCRFPARGVLVALRRGQVPVVVFLVATAMQSAIPETY